MRSSVVFLVLILIIVGLTVPVYFGGFTVKANTSMKRFSSREELRSFVATSGYSYRYVKGMLLTQDVKELSSLGSLASPQSPDYSKTNIQVEGVDEADIIKTDGEYIYIASGRSIMILKAYPPEEAAILSQITLNGTISGVFINGNKMVVFEGGPNSYYATLATLVRSYPYYGTSGTCIRVYDVSDRANPILTRNVGLDGCYFDSRMIGDYVYAVINEPVYVNESWVTLPRIYSDGEVEEIDSTEIYYSSVSDYFSTFTMIVSINLQNDAEEPTYETILLGSASNMYVSMNNIYITFQGEIGVEVRPSSSSRSLSVYESVWGTTIHRVHIENGEIEYVASGQVLGSVLNQFSMDEYNGNFRIATTTGEVWKGGGTSRNHVYVLDMNLNIVGKLEDLAPGEKIHSARFMGSRCYLVTFKKIDPLFVIDLSEPSDPEVLGELKVTGYSDYLHSYDENHIIGIGKETVEGEGGDFAWYQGVKISLFDVSDVEHPKEIDKYEIGDRGTDSPVLNNHKAFLFARSKNLLVIPALVAERPEGVPPWTQGTFVFQGAYVFNITLTEGFALRGTITHLHAMGLRKNSYYLDSSYYVERSLYIDDVLYTISSKKIKMNSLETLDQINEIELP